MSERGYITIVPALWGMGLLALGFGLYPLIGIWALIIILVIGVAGMFIGLTMMMRSEKKGGKEK